MSVLYAAARSQTATAFVKGVGAFAAWSPSLLHNAHVLWTGRRQENWPIVGPHQCSEGLANMYVQLVHTCLYNFLAIAFSVIFVPNS